MTTGEAQVAHGGGGGASRVVETISKGRVTEGAGDPGNVSSALRWQMAQTRLIGGSFVEHHDPDYPPGLPQSIATHPWITCQDLLFAEFTLNDFRPTKVLCQISTCAHTFPQWQEKLLHHHRTLGVFRALFSSALQNTQACLFLPLILA